VWIFLRRKVACDSWIGTRLWFKRLSPPTITWTHIKRSTLNAYVVLCFPTTKKAFTMLTCKPIECEDNWDERLVSGKLETCGRVLEADPSIKCWEGEHIGAAILAICVILVYVVILPVLLMRKIHTSNRRREQSFGMSRRHLREIFDSYDVDGSGKLDMDETRACLATIHGIKESADNEDSGSQIASAVKTALHHVKGNFSNDVLHQDPTTTKQLNSVADLGMNDLDLYVKAGIEKLFEISASAKQPGQTLSALSILSPRGTNFSKNTLLAWDKFELWYTKEIQQHCPNAFQTAVDVMYVATKTNARWWLLFEVLFLKTSLNVRCNFRDTLDPRPLFRV
jgi:hypothetical protein